MNAKNHDSLKQLDDLLAASNQSWLFGAGISFDAGIPLMFPLTDRVLSKAASSDVAHDEIVLSSIKEQLSEDAHIEHILSQLGDYRAIAERSREKTASFGETTLDL